MDQKVVDLYREFREGILDRREFFTKLTVLVGSMAAAYSLFAVLDAKADVVAEDDPRLETEMVTYPGATGDVMAYLARPREEGKKPAVIIIHENRGLQPHIKDVTRRMALEGFLAVAPDALSPLGGTPENDADSARTKMRELDGESTQKNFVAAVEYLKTHPLSTGKVGCTGFCWGGGMTNQVAVHAPDLVAAVPYYGRQPEVEDVPKIKASILAHYAGDDERINAGIPAFEKALKEAGIEYTVYIYEGAKHAFNNDANPERYHKEAAELAWQRTIAFFKDKLKT
ncbi:dienelactone hydrolase family protein [candidate division KSB1 bacterium]|nr:dienelactone hydrolase family protein [candidate division KSB1 bacterium]RQW05019.1 MAG: dienelactone hydrolase family protein [candidate division KSB1 bacterium]